MLALIIATTIASAGCQERCAADSSSCYSGCNGAGQCTHHCEGRAADCNAGCAKDVKKAEAAAKHKEMVCPNTEPGGPMTRPCTEAEKKRFAEALNSKQAKKALCKDAKGHLVACNADGPENTKEAYGIVKKDGVCHDGQGLPTACPETAEKLKKAGRRMSH